MNTNLIKRLVNNGGPLEDDFPALDAWFDQAHALLSRGVLSAEDLLALREVFGDSMSPATLQGFASARPHGYAGDFEIIDRIYCGHVSPEPNLARWDTYFQTRAAPKAVRNRKTYFHELLNRHSARCPHLHVLKLAIGPGRSMFEWLSVNPKALVTFHCIELDPKAIAYAQELNRAFLDRIHFEQQNVLGFRPTQQYDLVWAAGLFDYFDDRMFQLVVRRLLRAVAPGGELVVGNFSVTNPNRAYMEFGGWHLHHRTAEGLTALARGAGAGAEAITIGVEPEGVNLFLHVLRPNDTRATSAEGGKNSTNLQLS